MVSAADNNAAMARILALLEANHGADVSSMVTKDQRIAGRGGIRLLGAVTINLAYYNDTLQLMDICVDKAQRGRSLGSQALKQVLAVADQLELPVNLYARSHDRSPLKGYALSDWYERHGFVYTPAGHVRQPASASKSDTPSITPEEYLITTLLIDPDGGEELLAQDEIVASSSSEAESIAYERHWDERLRMTGCTLQCTTE